MGFSFQGGKATLVFHKDNGALELPVGLEGHFLSAPLEGTVLGANGRWRNRNTLEVEVRNTRMVSGQRMGPGNGRWWKRFARAGTSL